MNLDLSESELAFQAEARAWLTEARPTDPILRTASRSWESRFGLIGIG